MSDHDFENNCLIIDILIEIAYEREQDIDKVEALFARKHQTVTRRFWELLAEYQPLHPFTDAFQCNECGMYAFESAYDTASA